MTRRLIIFAFPEHEIDRARLRRIIPVLPAKYPDAIVLPCADCGMPLSVGPRSAAKRNEMAILCPWCTKKEVAAAGGQMPEVMNLGNPNSKWEKS